MKQDKNHSSANCLNCGTPLSALFCGECGQRGSTQRFHLSTLWDADFLEHNLNISKGLPKTLLGLLYRPGKLALEYIEGKRKSYFPFLGLFLILIAADLLVRQYSGISIEDLLTERFGITINAVSGTASKKSILTENYRLVLFLSVPLVALVQWPLLRRLRKNYWEHCVLVIFASCAQLWYGIIFTLPTLLLNNPGIEARFLNLAGTAAPIIVFVFYFQLLRKANYGWWGTIWRLWLLGLLFLIFTIGILATAIGAMDAFSEGL